LDGVNVSASVIMRGGRPFGHKRKTRQ